MTFIHRTDDWIARTLMHPPIVLLCQLLRISQHSFNRYLWWIVALHAVWLDDHKHIAFTVFFVLFALSKTISAARDHHREAHSSIYLRIFFLGSLTISVGMLPFGVRLDGTDLDILLALFAEYAATIKTIPPRKTREAKRRVATQGG